jgi:uncharacterized protein (DUF1330 family)
VRADVKDEEPVKRYVAGNHPIFDKYGGRYLVRAQKFAVPEGSSRSLTNKRLMHCNLIVEIERPPRAAVSPKSDQLF